MSRERYYPEDVAENHVRELRTFKGLKQRDLAEAVGKFANNISQLETGTLSPIGKDGKPKPWVLKICEILGSEFHAVFPREACSLDGYLQEATTHVVLTSTQLRGTFMAERDGCCISQYEQYEYLEKSTRKIPVRFRTAAALVWINGLSLEEAGVELGVSKQRIHQILDKVIVHMNAVYSSDLKRAAGGAYG